MLPVSPLEPQLSRAIEMTEESSFPALLPPRASCSRFATAGGLIFSIRRNVRPGPPLPSEVRALLAGDARLILAPNWNSATAAAVPDDFSPTPPSPPSASHRGPFGADAHTHRIFVPTEMRYPLDRPSPAIPCPFAATKAIARQGARRHPLSKSPAVRRSLIVRMASPLIEIKPSLHLLGGRYILFASLLSPASRHLCWLR